MRTRWQILGHPVNLAGGPLQSRPLRGPAWLCTKDELRQSIEVSLNRPGTHRGVACIHISIGHTSNIVDIHHNDALLQLLYWLWHP